ncbi:hypothetical protein [Mesorhizobium sp. ORS 3428]|uniref:hypothetical protein n=1 Tax=Mesorhizobium sp. ORS 3428 TaxID=540997 RepID=UPI0008D92245|nr:hypothetical protein ORS3428_21905 [Mesorhizobium sp. ORS 3428]
MAAACHARDDGPQPPKEHGVHQYHFRLSALDTETLNCGEKARIANILDHARQHVIDTTEFVGTYETR